MGKYSAEMTVDPHSIAGMLMGRIAPGSRVLEFGPAEGRMTQYMKEVLGCCVCIVEIDPDSYSKAARYAEDGLCDNIETGSWKEHFAGQQFDVILFADVLEHLREPQRILSETSKLLQPDGQVLLSLPNIGHNDVFAKLYNNTLDYTDLGLLDSTHVHFWGKENIIPFVEQAGYTVELLDGVYLFPFQTEQAAGIGSFPDALMSALEERDYNDVYQFFAVLRKKEWAEENKIKTADCLSINGPHNACFCYWDFGEGYKAENVAQLELRERDRDRFFCCNSVPDGCLQVRFDPTTCTRCVIGRISAIADSSQSCQVHPLNGEYLPDGSVLFYDVLPQLEFSLPEHTKCLEIHADIMACHGSQGDRLRSLLSLYHASNQSLADYQQRYDLAAAENTRNTAEIVRLTSVSEQLTSDISRLRDTVRSLQMQHNQDLLQIHAFKTEKDRFSSLYEHANAEFLKLSQSRWWKLTAPARKLVNRIKCTKIGRKIYRWIMGHDV